MKKFLFLALASFSLVASTGGCVTGAGTPSVYADKTVIDEQVGVSTELAYKASRLLTETAVDAGLLKGANATKAAALDNKAFAALVAMRTAYGAGNATDYITAAAQAQNAVAQIIAVVKGAK